MAEIVHEVVDHICVLYTSSTGWKKELNIIRWNNGAPKADIREWSPDKRTMAKGLTFTRDELEELKRHLNHMDLSKVAYGRKATVKNNEVQKMEPPSLKQEDQTEQALPGEETTKMAYENEPGTEETGKVSIVAEDSEETVDDTEVQELLV